MVIYKPEKETETCKHCRSEITPCLTGPYCCYGKGWIHLDSYIHGCQNTTDVAEPVEKIAVAQ